MLNSTNYLAKSSGSLGTFLYSKLPQAAVLTVLPPLYNTGSQFSKSFTVAFSNLHNFLAAFPVFTNPRPKTNATCFGFLLQQCPAREILVGVSVRLCYSTKKNLKLKNLKNVSVLINFWT